MPPWRRPTDRPRPPYVDWGAHSGLERRIKGLEDKFNNDIVERVSEQVDKFPENSEEENPEEESSEEEEIYEIDKVDKVEEGITANFTKKSWEKN